MAAWVTALVPLLVALVSAARWPTLGRRINGHAALLKDLPPDAAAELQPLLVAEVRILADRDRRRLDGRVDRLLNARRVALTVAALGSAAFLVYTVVNKGGDGAGDGKATPVGAVVVSLLSAVVAGVTAVLAYIRTRNNAQRAERMRRRAEEN